MIHLSKTAGNLELSLGLPSALRSLCFGGLLGLLITYLVCLNYPQIIIGGIALKYVLTFGAALGTSVHRIIDGLLVKSLLYPLRKVITYYSKVAELEIQKNKRLMDGETYKSIKTALDQERFLGSIQKDQKLLVSKTD